LIPKLVSEKKKITINTQTITLLQAINAKLAQLLTIQNYQLQLMVKLMV
jgi:hypothetical protein